MVSEGKCSPALQQGTWCQVVLVALARTVILFLSSGYPVLSLLPFSQACESGVLFCFSEDMQSLVWGYGISQWPSSALCIYLLLLLALLWQQEWHGLPGETPDLKPQWPRGCQLPQDWFSAKANWLFYGFPFWTWLLRPNLLPASCMTPSLQASYWPPTYVHDAPCCAELEQQHQEALSENSLVFWKSLLLDVPIWTCSSILSQAGGPLMFICRQEGRGQAMDTSSPCTRHHLPGLCLPQRNKSHASKRQAQKGNHTIYCTETMTWDI